MNGPREALNQWIPRQNFGAISLPPNLRLWLIPPSIMCYLDWHSSTPRNCRRLDKSLFLPLQRIDAECSSVSISERVTLIQTEIRI